MAFGPWDTDSPVSSTETALLVLFVAAVVVAVFFIFAVRSARGEGCFRLYREHPILFATPLLYVNLLWALDAGLPDSGLFGIPFLDLTFTALDLTAMLLTPTAVMVHLTLSHAAIRGTLGTSERLFAGWDRKLAYLILTYIMVILLMLGLMAPLFPFMTALGMTPFLIGLGLLGIVFNVLTCTWFAIIVEQGRGVLRGFHQAVVFGWSEWRLLLLPVLWHLLLLGFITFYSVTVTTVTRDGRPVQPGVNEQIQALIELGRGTEPGSHHTSVQTNVRAKRNFEVDVFSVLLLSPQCRWYEEICEGAERPRDPLTAYLLESLVIVIFGFFLTRYSFIYLRETDPGPEPLED